MGIQKPRTIAVANEKGGVGKTVTVINLSAALILENKRVLVVDMDPQANSTKGLGVLLGDDDISVYDLIFNQDTVFAKDAIKTTAWEGLDLIPSHVDLAGAEIEMADIEGRENLLKDALADIISDYDFIILDTPPSLSLLTVNVFCFATEVLVPCQTHPYAFDALENLLDTIDAVKEEINPNIRVTGIIPTFFDQRTKISRKIMAKLKQNENYGKLLFDTAIRINTTIAQSSDKGKPVVFFRRSSYGAIDYQDLAEELLLKS